MNVPDPTHHPCPEGAGSTHHLVPKGGVPTCVYCGATRSDLIEALTPSRSNDMSNLDNMLLDFHTLKMQQKALAAAVDDAQAALVAEMQSNGLNVLMTNDGDGNKVAGTLVVAERIVTDEGKLQSLLSDSQWEKVTKRVLDKTRLEAAVTLGVVDIETVSEASEMKVNKPFVKVTTS